MALRTKKRKVKVIDDTSGGYDWVDKLKNGCTYL